MIKIDRRRLDQFGPVFDVVVFAFCISDGLGELGSPRHETAEQVSLTRRRARR